MAIVGILGLLAPFVILGVAIALGAVVGPTIPALPAHLIASAAACFLDMKASSRTMHTV